MDITPYIAFARSIIQLMNPLVEVAIHDLKTNTIVFIEGNLSKRKIGDPSLIDNTSKTFKQEIDGKIYTKLGHDGKLIRSISIPIEERGNIVMLICINYDITLFKDMEHMSNQLLGVMTHKQPEALFKNDWQERLHLFIHEELNKDGLRIETLSQKQKKDLLEKLFAQKAFDEKNAADYIASILNIGRATVFNYLRKWRNHE